MAKYYTLMVKEEDGTWHQEFGDYDREVVLDEKDDYQDHGKKTRILTTSDHWDDIKKAVAKFVASMA